jgi:ubiquinone/menaquinone biosynthesis C-methylase UbiE
MKLSFKDNSFDVIICTHVYEHVPNPKKLFDEIWRVLKKDGICYLAAQNKLWPLEAHHNLLFLSYLPKRFADIYIKLLTNKKEYYEHPMTYWQLKEMLKKFKIHDYTPKILSSPEKFGYNKKIYFEQIFKFFTPTLFWLLEK